MSVRSVSFTLSGQQPRRLDGLLRQSLVFATRDFRIRRGALLCRRQRVSSPLRPQPFLLSMLGGLNQPTPYASHSLAIGFRRVGRVGLVLRHDDQHHLGLARPPPVASLSPLAPVSSPSSSPRPTSFFFSSRASRSSASAPSRAARASSSSPSMNRNRGSAASRARARLPPLPVAAVVVAAIGRAIGRRDRRSSSIARLDRADRARSRRASDTRATARPRDRANAPADAPRGYAVTLCAVTRISRASRSTSIDHRDRRRSTRRGSIDRSGPLQVVWVRFSGIWIRYSAILGPPSVVVRRRGSALGGIFRRSIATSIDRSIDASTHRGVDRDARSIDRVARPSARASVRARRRRAGVRDAGACFARSVGRRRRARW